jgi:hypothetical protein
MQVPRGSPVVHDGGEVRAHCAAVASFHHFLAVLTSRIYHGRDTNGALDASCRSNGGGLVRTFLPKLIGQRVAKMAAAATKVQWEQTGTENGE